MSRTLSLHEDPALQLAFRAGEIDALERVYCAYARSVERYLHAISLSRAVREVVSSAFIADLIQEVFSRAFATEARRAYAGSRDYGHYLAVVARNCFIDLMRLRRREILTSPDDLPFDIQTAPEPEGWCDSRTQDILEGYLAGLAPAVRDIYQRRFVLELSQLETAAALGITRRAVRTAERRLRAGLRKALLRAGIPLRRPLTISRVVGDADPVPPLATRRGEI
jgi:RNA polymerase sigma factor (sigma-70 family)